MIFFKESIKNIKLSGSLTPSSKYLIAHCLHGIDFKRTRSVLELGMGNGCITNKILEKSDASCKVISIEISEIFFLYGQAKFHKHKNLKLHHASAFDFDSILKKENIEKVDCIISSLPLSLFKKNELEILFKKIQQHLAPNGLFIQYQYSIGKYAYLKSIFSQVKVGFTLLNAPPALIFTCANL